MGFFDIFKKRPEEPEEYTELEAEEMAPAPAVKILVDKLENFASTDRILRNVKTGNIVFARIKELKAMDIGELKRAVTKIRTVCESIGGDVAGVGEDWLIITPSSARIDRESL